MPVAGSRMLKEHYYFLLKILCRSLLYVCACLACIYVYVSHACTVPESGESVRSLETGGVDHCEPPSGCWDSNQGPLEEQPVFLTTELSILPPINHFKMLGL